MLQLRVTAENHTQEFHSKLLQSVGPGKKKKLMKLSGLLRKYF